MLRISLVVIFAFLGCRGKESLLDSKDLKIEVHDTTVETTISLFVSLICEGNVQKASQLVVQKGEWIDLYPRMNNADSSSQSAKMMSSLYTNENRKHFKRWASCLEGIKLDRIESFISGKPEYHNGFAILTVDSILVDTQNKRFKLPILKSLLLTKDGNKIVSVLDKKGKAFCDEFKVSE